MTTLKEKIRKRELTIGSWITLGSPAVTEIMAKAGFDWLTIDMEHSAITLSQAQELVRVVNLCGISSLVRVGENNPNLIKRVMDTGAYGVIVPMVNTEEDAINAVNAVKYPPIGSRGVGLARAQGYGLEFNQYKKWLVKNSVVIIQIEHIKAVENLEKILSVNGIDAFIVGPYDLSGSLGHPGEFDHLDMKDALRRIKEVADKLHIPAGYHVVEPNFGLLQRKVNEGYKFLAFCFDALFLGTICKESLLKIKKSIKRSKL